MTKKEIESLLIEVITEIITLNGYTEVVLDPKIRPLDDLGVFDSHNALEATVILSERIGKEIDAKVFGLSCKGGSTNLNTISEIAENILNHIH